MRAIFFLMLCTVALAVQAGPLDQKRAESHLAAVAAGDVEALVADYAENAYMDWIGGPLEGRYTGKPAIRAVWQKFVAANDGQPRPAKLGKLSVYANAKGASFATEAEYGGKTPIKVWHVLVFRDGEMTSEIWQIAPAIKLE